MSFLSPSGSFSPGAALSPTERAAGGSRRLPALGMGLGFARQHVPLPFPVLPASQVFTPGVGSPAFKIIFKE